MLGNFRAPTSRCREARELGECRAACSATARARGPRHARARGRRASTGASADAVQNVHAMRPEMRADYERALAHVAGDAAFAVRFERWFGELRARSSPSTAPTRASRRRGRPCSRRSRAAAAARPATCARSTTSARSRPTGCTASRPSATSRTPTGSPARCAGSASGSVPARARRRLPAPHAAAARAAGAERRRLRGRRLRRGRAGARDDGRPARARGRPARRRHGAVRRRGPQPHRARARVGPGGDGRRRAEARLLPHVRRPHRAGRLRARRCPRSSPTPRRGASPGCPSSTAGCGRRSTTTSGTSTGRTPRCSSRWPR